VRIGGCERRKESARSDFGQVAAIKALLPELSCGVEQEDVVPQGASTQYRAFDFRKQKFGIETEIRIEPQGSKEREGEEDIVTVINLQSGHDRIGNEFVRGVSDRIDGEDTAQATVAKRVVAEGSGYQQNSEMRIARDSSEITPSAVSVSRVIAGFIG